MQKGRFRDSADSVLNMMSVLGVDRSKIHIEDVYEISFLVSLYVTKSSLPLVLSVDLPDRETRR